MYICSRMCEICVSLTLLQKKLIQCCKSTILQLNIFNKKNELDELQATRN